MTDCNFVSQNQFSGEPALEEMIADPIVRAVMRVDGLLESDLRRALSRARKSLAKGALIKKRPSPAFSQHPA